MHHAVLPGMVARGGGRIVNIASDAARGGSSGEAVYAACKGGLVALSKTLARGPKSAQSSAQGGGKHSDTRRTRHWNAVPRIRHTVQSSGLFSKSVGFTQLALSGSPFMKRS